MQRAKKIHIGNIGYIGHKYALHFADSDVEDTVTQLKHRWACARLLGQRGTHFEIRLGSFKNSTNGKS